MDFTLYLTSILTNLLKEGTTAVIIQWTSPVRKAPLVKEVGSHSWAGQGILSDIPELLQWLLVRQVAVFWWRNRKANCQNGATSQSTVKVAIILRLRSNNQFPVFSRVPYHVQHQQQSWNCSDMVIPLHLKITLEPPSTYAPVCAVWVGHVKNGNWRHTTKPWTICWQHKKPKT